LGANAFLPTPFVTEKFLAYVHKLLRGEVPKQANRVLIVEDDSRVVDLLKKTFGQHGYLTAGAYNAHDALRLCREQTPEIVVVDFHLPTWKADLLLDEICKLSPQSAVSHESRATRARSWRWIG